MLCPKKELENELKQKSGSSDLFLPLKRSTSIPQVRVKTRSTSNSVEKVHLETLGQKIKVDSSGIRTHACEDYGLNVAP